MRFLEKTLEKTDPYAANENAVTVAEPLFELIHQRFEDQEHGHLKQVFFAWFSCNQQGQHDADGLCGLAYPVIVHRVSVNFSILNNFQK